MNLLKLILIVLLIPGVLLILNFSKLRRLKKLMSGYEEYIKNPSSQAFHEKKCEIIGLFQSAGLRDPQVPLVQMVDPMHIVRGNYSVFDNLTVLKPEFISAMQALFLESIGVYKKRVSNSINPVYWLEVIFFLPEKIINYFGMSNGSQTIAIVSKTLNIVYWVAGIAITFLIYYFRIKLIYLSF